MMRKTLTVIAVGLLAVSLAVVGVAMQKKPRADGAEVIRYITQTNDYHNWDLWPGKDKLYKGQHPHGAFLTTYVSNGAFAALNAKAGKIPVGEMVVKENYTPAKKLAAITVMYRVDGFDPKVDDWFWLKYGPDGAIMKEGKVAGCINCHTDVKDNDWLYTGPTK